jgi:hypothetical protein
MKESNMPRADFIVSIVLVVFGIGIIWSSLAMPRFEDQGGTIWDSPGIVPGLLGVLITGFSLSIFFRSIARKGYRLGISKATVGGVLKDGGTLRIILTIVVGVLYGLVLLRYLHFIASTIIFVFAFIVMFEYDAKKSLAAQWKVPVFALLTAVLTTGGVYGTFQYLFLVNLP